MNCFRLVKQVLDEAFAQIPGSEDEKYQRIRAELRRLSGLYRDLTVYRAIDYSDPVTRFAYVFCYVVSHANLVHDRVTSSRPIRELFDGDRAMVSCIGGGPGSELIGILKYLEWASKEIVLTCHIYDKETAWGETWDGLFELTDSGIQVLPSFNSFDVTDAKSWRKFSKFLKSDLFAMIYFMSEVYGLKAQAEPFFDYVFGSAKPGALFLFVDNRHSSFSGWFDTLASKNGLTILDEGDGPELIPVSEEKRDLGEYFTNLQAPKIRADIAWRVAQKES